MLAALKCDFFTISGRIGRLRYWKLTMKSALIATLILVCAVIAGGYARYAFLLIAALALFFSFVTQTTIVIRRFHDHNQRGWGSFGVMLIATLGSYAAAGARDPVIEFAAGAVLFGFTVYLGFFRGTKGWNSYGRDPLESGEP